jgi:hypothetical protein
MQRFTSIANTQATVNIPRLANMRAWNVMQSHLPSNLYCIVSLPIAHAQTDSESKPEVAR